LTMVFLGLDPGPRHEVMARLHQTTRSVPCANPLPPDSPSAYSTARSPFGVPVPSRHRPDRDSPCVPPIAAEAREVTAGGQSMKSCANGPCSRKGSSPTRAGRLGRVIGAEEAGTNELANSGWSELRQSPTRTSDSPWMTWLGRGLTNEAQLISPCSTRRHCGRGCVAHVFPGGVPVVVSRLGISISIAQVLPTICAPRTLTHQRLSEETLLLGALEPHVAQQLRCTGSATASAYIPTDRSNPADPVDLARRTHR
jgi:hypothetical protein